MKANIIGLPGVPFTIIDGHYKVGDKFNVDWTKSEYEVYKADPITRKDQLQNVYLREVKE